jgi:hypothetical protein
MKISKWNCAKCGFPLDSNAHKQRCVERRKCAFCGFLIGSVHHKERCLKRSFTALERQQREKIRKNAKSRINGAKRRELGFIPLNNPFAGSVAHHIDKECVVYIPRELHVLVRHNVWTSKGMTEINDRVFEWLEQLSY